MNDKLKPCPFCGHEAEIKASEEKDLLGNRWHFGKCTYCGTEGWYDLGKSGAIEAWNTRPLEAQLLEACKVAYKAIKSLPIDALGEGSYGWNGEECKYPIRDEILNNIAAAIAAAEGDAT